MEENKLKGVLEALEEVNAKDIHIYKTSTSNPFFDYGLVATAVANRQMDGLVSKLIDKSSTYDFSVRGVEGKGGSGWLLVDLGFAIVNLFTYEERERYDLDKVWSKLDKIEIDDIK